MFSISDFKSKNANGFLKPTKFEFQLLRKPTALQNYVTSNIDMTFLCEGALLPGVAMNTHQIRRYGYGIEETKPVFPVFQKLSLSLLSDGDGKSWRFFKDWISIISNYKNSTGSLTNLTNAGNGINSSLNVYEINYRRDYQAEAKIIQFDDTGKKIISVNFNNIFPIAVADTQLNWGQTGQVQRINVVMSYQDWYEDLVSK